MAGRTEDPPRTRLQVVDVATSPAPSPPARRALHGTDDHLPTVESFRAVLSSQERAGRWEPADEIEVRAIFGEVTLDFRRAELPPSGVIEIDAWAFCGEVKIILPDGAEIELDGTPVLGSIEQQVREAGARHQIRERVGGARDEVLPASPPPPEPPYFRVDARAILGGIKVTGG